MTEEPKIEMQLASSQDMAEALLQMRLSQKETQQEAADEVDIHRVYLSRMETGDISVAYIERFLDLVRHYGGELVIRFKDGDK